MPISLFPHNQTAYASLLTVLETEQRACIIHPTGTGKSFIGFKYCEEHPTQTVLWLSPSAYIFKTQCESLLAAGAQVPENISYMTYAKLSQLDPAELNELRPDVIIRMPDNKQIIVDSKVSLVAYEQLQHAESDEQYRTLLRAHTDSLKQHVKELYDKQYQRATGLNTPDFVLMFVPIEASYSVAIQADSTLYDYALERKIVIVSPTTLLATLHTISYVWKQENQSKNAMEIARLAGAMYDKLCGMTEDFQKVQKSLDAAQKAYAETYKKLSEGNGNVLRTADRIRELGAKASKNLPLSAADAE